MKTYAIVAAAQFNASHFRDLDARGGFDCVIAVDGGYDHLLHIGRDADAVLGDFDSLGYIPQHCCLDVHNPRKDASDLELAIDRALAEGASKLVVYGCLSGRLDHTVAALQQLARASEAGAEVVGVGDAFAVRALTGPGEFFLPAPTGISFREWRGVVSVFPACDCAHGVTEVGLEYPLEKAELSNRTSLGLSNELKGERASVSVESGTIYVFYPL